jgi:hypothetical protein
MHFLLQYLWIAPHIFLGLSIVVFLRRGLQHQFPFFFTYALFELFSFLTLIITDLLVVLGPVYRLNLYRWILVWGLGISSLLSFGVIYELVNHMILSRSALAPTLRPVLRWSAAVLLPLTAIASGRLAVTGVERVTNVFQLLDFSSSVLQVGLLAVLFLFSRVLRVSWRSFPVGIALGFGILGCVELSAAALLSVFGTHGYAAIDAVRLAAFHVCVLVWLCYLVFPEREPKFAGKSLQKSELELWDQELQRMVER